LSHILFLDDCHRRRLHRKLKENPYKHKSNQESIWLFILQ